MKYEYIKNGKSNYKGAQFRKGAILELESLGQLPENWFRVVKEKKITKLKLVKKIVKEKPEVKIVKTKIENKKVIDYGDNKNSD